MPFIAQGKTNIKYILIVIILAAIAGGGILAYQYWWVPKKEVTLPEVKIPEPAEKGEIVFDVYYSIVSVAESPLSGTEMLNIITIPKIVDSDNEKKQGDFNNYSLSWSGEKLPEYTKIKENVSLQEAIQTKESLFKNYIITSCGYCLYSVTYPTASSFKKGIVSITFNDEGSGGAHPFYGLNTMNYDLKSSKEIKWDEVLTVSQDEFKSFIKDKRPESKFCREEELNIVGFYFTEKEFVAVVWGRRLNRDCPESKTFSFAFDELKDIATEGGIISRLAQ
jgi:hypothetical protein